MTTPAPFPPAWITAFTLEELERLAIRTVDGEMTDAEALAAEGLNRKLWAAKSKGAKP
jgi:hypothetical protein